MCQKGEQRFLWFTHGYVRCTQALYFQTQLLQILHVLSISFGKPIHFT